MQRCRLNVISRRNFVLGSVAISAIGTTTLDAAAKYATPNASGAFDGATLARAVTQSVNSIAGVGLTVVYPRPFEIDLLRDDPEMCRAVTLRAFEIAAKMRFDPADFSDIELVEMPKLQYGARRVFTVMQPLDAVAYLALALLAAPAIERTKIPAEDKVIFSHRYAPGPKQLFDPNYTHVSFREEIDRRRRDGEFLVTCDIANFYDSVSINGISDALRRAGVVPELTTYLAELLKFWSRRENAGLPVMSYAGDHNNGSHLLAEAMLTRVDHSLRNEGIAFIRHVDDFRLFLPDESSAKRALELTRDLLAREGLALNENKTRLAYDLSPQQIEKLRRGGYQKKIPVNPVREQQEYEKVLSRLDYNQRLSFREFHKAWSADPDHKAFGILWHWEHRLVPGRRDTWELFWKSGPHNRDDSGFCDLAACAPFQPPKVGEIQDLRLSGEKPEAAPFLQGELAPPKAVRHAIQLAVYGGHVDFIAAVPDLLVRYPELTGYAVDALIHGSASLPDAARRHLSGRLATALFAPETPAFATLRLLDLLAHDDYRERATLEKYARSLLATPRGVRFRAALDALRRTGGIPSDFYAAYRDGDAWARRALLADAAEYGSANLSAAAYGEREPFAAVIAGRINT